MVDTPLDTILKTASTPLDTLITSALTENSHRHPNARRCLLYRRIYVDVGSYFRFRELGVPTLTAFFLLDPSNVAQVLRALDNSDSAVADAARRILAKPDALTH